MARAREPLGPRILRNMSKRGECWIWAGSKTRDGYGVLTIGRKQYRAHRISYMLFKGHIPEELLICHTCDTPLCVNPDHLVAWTPKQNTQDMISKDRRVSVSGADHHATKVSHEQRDQIRLERANGATLKALAKKYNVAFQTISVICLRRRNYGTR